MIFPAVKITGVSPSPSIAAPATADAAATTTMAVAVAPEPLQLPPPALVVSFDKNNNSCSSRLQCQRASWNDHDDMPNCGSDDVSDITFPSPHHRVSVIESSSDGHTLTHNDGCIVDEHNDMRHLLTVDEKLHIDEELHLDGVPDVPQHVTSDVDVVVGQPPHLFEGHEDITKMDRALLYDALCGLDTENDTDCAVVAPIVPPPRAEDDDGDCHDHPVAAV